MISKQIHLSDQQFQKMKEAAYASMFGLLAYIFVYLTSCHCQNAETQFVRVALVAFLSWWLYSRVQQIQGNSKVVDSWLNVTIRPILVMLGMCLGGGICYLSGTPPYIGWLLGGGLMTIDSSWFKVDDPDYRMRLIRGTFILHRQQVIAKLRWLIRKDDVLLNWAGLPLPERFSSGHFFIIGAVGSGKTVLMRLLLQSILPRIKPGSGWRAIINDPKKEVMGMIASMAIHCRVVNLNAADLRSYAWAIAKDINTPAAATQLSHCFVKDEGNGENAFFVRSARDLLEGVVVALIITQPGKWTLSQLFSILADKKQMRELLKSCEETRSIEKEHFSRDEKALNNVLSTITANISPLRRIAALYSKSDKGAFSLQEWIEGECILVLGNDEKFREPLNAINQLIFKRLKELLLSQGDSDTRRTWVCLDELEEAGPYNGLSTLLTEGRSKGVRGILATQLIEGLHAKYGKEMGNKLANICSNKGLLRTDSLETAQWQSGVIGKAHVKNYKRSIKGREVTYNEGDKLEDAVLPSQFLRLPQANRERFYGYFVVPALAVFSTSVYFSKMLMKVISKLNFIPRPEEDQYLYSRSEKEDDEEAEVDLMDIPRMTKETLYEDLNDDEGQDSVRDSEEEDEFWFDDF